MIVAIVGASVGVVFAIYGHRSAPSPPAAEPPARLVPVPFTVAAQGHGAFELSFAGGTTLPGFRYYVVVLDGHEYFDVLPGQEKYRLTPEAQVRHCFLVDALVATDKEIPQRDAGEQCLAADGSR
jgi:hypothetical protein